MDPNPYESPESRYTSNLPPGAHPAHGDSPKDIEGAVAIAVAMLLAGAWAGCRYQGASFFLILMTVTVGIFVGTVVYAVAARRYGVLLFLPLVLVAILAQEVAAAVFLFVGIVGSPIAVSISAFRPTRRNWIVAARMGILVLASIASLFLYDQLQFLGALRTAERGKVLLEAIDRFQIRERRLPSSLDDLVPRDLPSIPDTGMVGFPAFEYVGPSSEAAGDEKRLFAKYELRVNLYKVLQFDCLVYWPEGNYPEGMYGGGVERIGDWAYVHE